MKKLFVLLFSLISCSTLFAQDVITKRDGTDIEAKVIDVGLTQITYKKYSNPEGPTYTMRLSDILMITYQNGEREVYAETKESKESSLPSGVMSYIAGRISIGGIIIEDELLDMYFTPSDLKLYQNGKSRSRIGGVLGIIGAIPFGYGVGWLIGSSITGKAFSFSDTQTVLAAASAILGGTIMISGLVFSIKGDTDAKKAISNYNAALAFQPTLQIGATNNGLGIAFVF